MTPRTEADERALVETLAAAMREKLALNRHKGSWRAESIDKLGMMLDAEVQELSDALTSKADPAAVLAEAADVAFDRLVEQGLLSEDDPQIDAVTKAMATIAARAIAAASRRS